MPTFREEPRSSTDQCLDALFAYATTKSIQTNTQALNMFMIFRNGRDLGTGKISGFCLCGFWRWLPAHRISLDWLAYIFLWITQLHLRCLREGCNKSFKYIYLVPSLQGTSDTSLLSYNSYNVFVLCYYLSRWASTLYFAQVIKQELETLGFYVITAKPTSCCSIVYKLQL